jgi:cellulose synthase/poly-beta-1,6-N-acetylglucosamine synthase-like glycosyltransferase
MSVIEGESFPEGYSLERVIIVASGCDASSLSFIRNLKEIDRRVVLVEEPQRYGKSEAINKILDRYVGDFLVLVNGDALPGKGAIGELLLSVSRDYRVGMVAGRPVFESREGPISNVLDLMWTAHSLCSLQLNHQGTSNQCSDELMVARAEVIHELPRGVVNDGAYLAGTAYSRGYRIKFCSEAVVRIDVPKSFIDLIQQRRRIIFGHFQIWKLVGKPPRTVETLFLTSPVTSLKVVIRTLSSIPRLILALPLAAVIEMVSMTAAVFDSLRSTKKHAVWKRYGS